MTERYPQAGSDWKVPEPAMPMVWVEALGVWVGKYMVANEEFRRFRPEHDSGEFSGKSLNEPRQPVVSVSYDDAMGFCDWLTARARETGAIPDSALFRLPSDRDWTTYARCGDGRQYPWGNEWPPTFGNYGDESAKRCFPDWEPIAGYDDGHPVSCAVEDAGENPWGLVGVGGNAYEWTFVAGGTACELRGGSWSTNQREYLSLTNRYQREPGSRLINFGFRIVLFLGPHP